MMKFQLLTYTAALAMLIAAPVASEESASLVGTARSLKGIAFRQQVPQVIHVLKGDDGNEKKADKGDDGKEKETDNKDKEE
eukprot:CAMPEP_0201879370 /NCGR_PEP_ID=MMETSP0902-20130614/10267_1 /ASSEMBLY_ACC=CAM_ASM_000551 /TAXON_ID=420261 /ORGANISM="Thalassiosira antarctica, Strain CCMP982" /LENGTH=80 /DNA_ID=CAMNT_0048407171 /DNA_START=1 /DNA_END=240 /DNA_ORIENTATION=+